MAEGADEVEVSPLRCPEIKITRVFSLEFPATPRRMSRIRLERLLDEIINTAASLPARPSRRVRDHHHYGRLELSS